MYALRVGTAALLFASGCVQGYFVRAGSGKEEFLLDVAACQTPGMPATAESRAAVRACLREKGWAQAVPVGEEIVPVSLTPAEPASTP